MTTTGCHPYCYDMFDGSTMHHESCPARVRVEYSTRGDTADEPSEVKPHA